MLGGVGILHHNCAISQLRAGTATAVGSVAVRAPPLVDLSADNEFGVGRAIGAERHLWRLARTCAREHHYDQQRGEERSAGGGCSHEPHDTERMGMDPTRPHRKRPTDYLYVAAGCIAAFVLLFWVLFGSA